jgi:hypothetical protein
MTNRALTLCAYLYVFAASPVHATDYYISGAGNDANSGLSPALAWRTIARANAAALHDGDRLLLEGGATFAGTVVFDASDGGSPAAPLTLASYGVGRATITAASGAGVLVYNRAAVRLASVIVAGTMAAGSSGIVVYTDVPAAAPHAFVRIEDTEVVGFAQDGIQIGAWSGAPGFANVRIERTIARGNGRTGILTFADRPNVHRDVYVGYSKAFNNRGVAGASTNTGSGIVLGGVDGGTIERSVAHDNGELCTAGDGPVGIWAYDSTRILIQHNESYRNRTGGAADGGGFDFDQNVTNSVMQFNYSHDNDGAGYLLAHARATNGHRGNIIRYNISQNDGRRNGYGAIEVWGRILDADIHNNTVFTSYVSATTKALHLHNRGVEQQHPERVRFWNNILQTTGGAPVVTVTSAVLDGALDVRFEHNLYWSGGSTFKLVWNGLTHTSLSAWQIASGQETRGGVSVGIVDDPQLAAPGTGITYDNASLTHDLWQYRLAATSPAIDTGLEPEPGSTPAPGDYFGAPSALHRPDIGAHEYHGACNWTITPASMPVPSGGGPASVNVDMSAVWGCGWAVTHDRSWVTVSPDNGSGPGSFSLAVLRNDGPARTASIRVANQMLVVSQPGVAAPLPSAWTGRDIGHVGVAGETTFSGGTWTLRGAGADVWGRADGFQFAYQRFDGDVEIEARVGSVQYIHAWTKAGVMIRGSLEPGSAHASMIVTPRQGIAFQHRTQNGGTSTNVTAASGTAPYWVKLVRRGARVSAYRKASSASTWTHAGDATIALGTSVYVGLFVTSHDAARLATASFDNVAVRPTDPPQDSEREDIVLWAAEAPIRTGWTISADAGAAGGQRLQNANSGAAKLLTALAAPTQYFEMSLNALAGRGYRLWIRGKAISNSGGNDSVHVQFDRSTDASGNPVARIGTTGSYAWNLEDCSGCGLSGWGWQDNGWGIGVMGPLVYFDTTGTQRIRVQVREDGVGIDQIVLSAVRWVSAAPGPMKNDATILAKQ